MAYTRLVSDCLDVFEFLFNKKYHENQWGDNVKIVVKEWNKAVEMKELHDKVPILYNALNSIYDEDIKEDKLFFVILEKDGKEYLLGTSSPMTGFVTPPDMDKSDVSKIIHRQLSFRGACMRLWKSIVKPKDSIFVIFFCWKKEIRISKIICISCLVVPTWIADMIICEIISVSLK